jgi:hypothetical protein
LAWLLLRDRPFLPSAHRADGEAVCRAADTASAALQNVRIDHCRANVLMPEEFLRAARRPREPPRLANEQAYVEPNAQGQDSRPVRQAGCLSPPLAVCEKLQKSSIVKVATFATPRRSERGLIVPVSSLCKRCCVDSSGGAGGAACCKSRGLYHQVRWNRGSAAGVVAALATARQGTRRTTRGLAGASSRWSLPGPRGRADKPPAAARQGCSRRPVSRAIALLRRSR